MSDYIKADYEKLVVLVGNKESATFRDKKSMYKYLKMILMPLRKSRKDDSRRPFLYKDCWHRKPSVGWPPGYGGI